MANSDASTLRNPLDLRNQTLEKIKSVSYDLCIIGAGITGAGIARDAAGRGLKVILLDKADFASGTSSQSSKLLHGGVRYMERFEFGLVRESIRERDALCRNAAHLARPTPFIYPIFETDKHGPFSVNLGMWLYSALAGFRRDRRHKMLKPAQLAKAEPQLRLDGIRGATQYVDCMTDDGRLTLETALDAIKLGADVLTRMPVTGLLRDSEAVVGVEAQDSLIADEIGAQSTKNPARQIRAKKTVAALGPWTDRLLGPWQDNHAHFLRPTKGVHLVVSAERLKVEHAIVMRSPDDQRILFVIPWKQRTIIGTTDTDDEFGPDHCFANSNDVDYLLRSANHYFPNSKLKPADVISTWSGLRPLLRADDLDPSAVSREHEIRELEPGLVCIFGGKLTTYREMAEQCVDFCNLTNTKSQTLDRCLPGCSETFQSEELTKRLQKNFNLAQDCAEHLVATYGKAALNLMKFAIDHNWNQARIESDLPFIWAEVSYVTHFELALTTSDCLRRRIQIFLKSRNQGLNIVEQVADIQAGILAWSEATKTKNIEAYRRLVDESRRFRAETVSSNQS